MKETSLFCCVRIIVWTSYRGCQDILPSPQHCPYLWRKPFLAYFNFLKDYINPEIHIATVIFRCLDICLLNLCMLFQLHWMFTSVCTLNALHFLLTIEFSNRGENDILRSVNALYTRFITKSLSHIIQNWSYEPPNVIW